MTQTIRSGRSAEYLLALNLDDESYNYTINKPGKFDKIVNDGEVYVETASGQTLLAEVMDWAPYVTDLGMFQEREEDAGTLYLNNFRFIDLDI